MSYYLANNITFNVIPWFYVDESAGRVYLLSFGKSEQDVEDALYENYYALEDRSGIFSDQEANDFLTFANLVTTVFTSNTNSLIDTKAFKGSQIGGANAKSLYFLREGAYYQFDANASFDADGVKGLQFWQILTGDEGVLSTPAKFILDKTQNTIDTVVGFNYEPLVQIAVGLDNSGLTNACVIFHYNSNHGYVSNKVLTTTTDVKNTLVSFLPSIHFAPYANTIYNDVDASINVTASITYSNSFAYPSAQTKIFIDTNAGYVTPKELLANSSANLTISGLNISNGNSLKLTAGWENYRNVANLSFDIKDTPVFRQWVIEGGAGGQDPNAGTTVTIPFFTTELIVELWGAGGQGAQVGFPGSVNGANGQNTSFSIGNVALLATGGIGGHPNSPSAGGVASGGDVNANGGSAVFDAGGSSPFGSNGGFRTIITLGGSIQTPTAPDAVLRFGGGGGGDVPYTGGSYAGGAGAGAYVMKRFTPNTITIGANATITVGMAIFSGFAASGGQGGEGAISLRWR